MIMKNKNDANSHPAAHRTLSDCCFLGTMLLEIS